MKLGEVMASIKAITAAIIGIFMVPWTLATLASGTASAEIVGISSATNSLYSIDTNTGNATFISTAGGNYNGVGLSYLSGELFASDLLLQIPPPDWDIQTAKIDPVTGTSTPIGMQDGSLNWHGLASDEAHGVLYSIALDQVGQPLKTMTSTGVVSTIGTGTGIDGEGMAFDDVNGILYATNRGDESLYSINVSTGVAQRIGALGIGIAGDLHGLAYDEINETLYLNGTVDNVRLGNLYSINVTTGQATLIGSNGIEIIDGLAWIVPEPSITDTCDVGGGPNDIDTVSASFDDLADEIVVEMVLCADADNRTMYRFFIDHEDNTNLDGDGIDDGPDTLDSNPDCVKTWDDRMIHKSSHDRGPGTIDVAGNTLTYRVGVDDLNPFLELGDTVLIWTDTKLKKVNDKAPNTDAVDGCAKPEVANEVISLELN